MTSDIYSRIIHYDPDKNVQVRIGINEFRDKEYLFVRKYFEDFDGEWRPSKEGVNMPLDLNNSREMFSGLVEILSLGERKDILTEHFKDLIEDTYQ